ncbi:amidophosphoribosyltransferase [Cyanobacterium stanieri PCC 7202]|uniref:Amidophosphoribosyltransferase n=1 Tax=Cyanobacterium stanieri (strain ATCC 29140 / PCC 7202) TaxID=292563 RepID=K9YQL2_CYASC|nr:amidophosphoribosyltransferase [Cyanobacterium stanieri PCC 7202]
MNSFLSFLFNSPCSLCEAKTNNIICEYCYHKLISCQLSNPIIKLPNKDYFLFIWGGYENYLKRSIFTLKYDHKKELGEVFGQFLAKSWFEHNLWEKNQKITIVPIPLHPQKIKERGFNQAELVAKSFCEITGYHHLPNLLTRVKNTDAMFGLNPTARKNNITQAFTMGKDYPRFNRQHSVIILDDIYTTGATVEEVIRVLNILQIKVLGVMAIASSLKIKNHGE